MQIPRYLCEGAHAPAEPMTSSEIKQVRSLSQKKFRDSTGLFVVEGEKMVAEALASGFRVERIYRREEIGEAAMARITQLSSPSPVLAVLHQRQDPPAPLKKGLYLVLDAIRDPGNLGTILRLADWFGVEAVYASPDTVERYNPKVVQATKGAIFRVPFHSLALPPFLQEAAAGGAQVYGTFLDGDDLYARPLETGRGCPALLVIGNESNGISPAVAACTTARLLIPPFPRGKQGPESLNAAVATAVAVAEFRRQYLAQP